MSFSNLMDSWNKMMGTTSANPPSLLKNSRKGPIAAVANMSDSDGEAKKKLARKESSFLTFDQFSKQMDQEGMIFLVLFANN